MKIRDVASGDVRDVTATNESRPGMTAVRDGKTVWVHFKGRTYRLERHIERGGAHGDSLEHDLFAPMPGKVMRVLVSEGDDVKRGAPLLLLEAMKMEHEIKAPHDGRVVRVFRAEGEMVALGDPLIELEEAERTP